MVVVGAGYAGLMAAARLARQPGLEVTLVEPSPVFVERIRLHQWAAGEQAPVRPLRELLARRVRWVQDRAAEIDLAGRAVRLAGSATLGYEQLVLAVGSRIDRARVPGAAEHGLALETGAALQGFAGRARALARRGGTVAVVGFGLTGIEAASELAEAFPGLRVVWVGRGRLESAISRGAAAHVRTVMARLGAEIREEAEVVAVHADRLELAEGPAIACDECVWAGGFRAPDLAARAGLPVDPQGRVRVDAGLRAYGFPEVLVVGDAAHAAVDGPLQDLGRPLVEIDAGPGLRMACASAMPMGAHAADQVIRGMTGRPPAPARIGDWGRCVSLGRRDGFIQRTDPDGGLRPGVLSGRMAAIIKEMVCRTTVVVLRAEARGVALYRWPHPQPRLAPAVAAVHS